MVPLGVNGTPQSGVEILVGGWSRRQVSLRALTNATYLLKCGQYLSIRWQRCLRMKNVYEVLRQKELELARLEKEVEALRVAAPLLSEDKEMLAEATNNKPAITAQQPIRMTQPAVNTNPQPATRAVGWEDTAKRWP